LARLRLRSAAKLIIAAAGIGLAAGFTTVPTRLLTTNDFRVNFSPSPGTIACNATPGTVVGSVLSTLGNGHPITFSLTGGDTTDFVVSGTRVVVAPGGITLHGCPGPNTTTVTVQASQ
jgi:hypothetical protein